MLDSIGKYLKKPSFADEEQNRKANLLQFSQLILFLGSLVGLILFLFYVDHYLCLVFVFGLVGIIVSFLLLRSGHLRSASLTMLLWLLASMLLIIIYADGIHDMMVFLFPIMILMSSMLLDRRYFIAYSMIVSLSLMGVIICELTGIINNQMSHFTTLLDLVSVGALMIITIALADMFSETNRRSFARVDQAKCSLMESNRKLQNEMKERKNVERALKESEKRFRSLFEKIVDPVFLANPQTRQIVDCNNQAVKMMEYSKKKLFSMRADELHPDDVRERTMEKFKKQAKGELRVVDTEVITKSGKRIPVSINTSMIELDGKPHMVGIFRDITERRKAEQRKEQLLKELEEKNKELNEFAYVVSHDLKAPLRGISSLSQWISEDYSEKLDDEGRKQLRLLRNRVAKMHNLIEAILEYSRIGRTKGSREMVNLNNLVKEAVDLLAVPDNIQVKIVNELPIIRCERTRFEQLFQNLIGNAVKYNDKPKGIIRIGCKEEKNRWQFFVSDNGPGIDEKYHDRIFQIFQTLTPQEGVDSTGIGLTIAKKIVEVHKGEIWVESGEGKGATFHFTIPKNGSGKT